MDKQEDINDEDDLYRRIPHLWYVEKEDRVSSAAFTNDKVSVDWARYTTPQKTVADFPDNYVAALQAKIPREKGQKVRHDPIPNNYSHSLIIGKKTESVKRYLARNCKFVLKNT